MHYNKAMKNIIDYIKEYGNLTLEEYPFNNVDSLILSQISYIKFENSSIDIESEIHLLSDFENEIDTLCMAGISREHLSRIESGKVAVTEEMKVKLLEALEKFNPEAPLTMLFDYVRIRFPTLDIGHIIKDILQLNIQYMIHEDFGHYSYTEHYYIGDIFVYTSPDEEKGVLLELKGKGCRQFESYLLAQERSWYDFLMDALVDGGVMKRDCSQNFESGCLRINNRKSGRS